MTQKDKLYRGMKYLSAALPLMFIGPSVVYNAFMNKQNIWHYLVLIVGILICLSAVYIMCKGINIIIKSIFNE